MKKLAAILLMSLSSLSLGAAAAEQDGEAHTTAITLTAGNVVISAELNDSETSRQFIASLPRTLTLSRYADREYYSGVEPLSTNGELIADYEDGDVTYYEPLTSVAIFFAGAEHNEVPGLIRMGKITSALSDFEDLGQSVEVRIELAK